MSIFNQVPPTKASRSTHGLSHQLKGSYQAGKLYPILTELAFPGDTWSIRLEQFIRSMPMIAPVMDRVDVKVDMFFVPLRLIWDDWEDFITLGPTGEFTAERPTITVPKTAPTSAPFAALKNAVIAVGGLADHLRFPTPYKFQNGVAAPDNLVYDALPFRAYQLIYNEYYRNESVDPELVVLKSSGNTNLSTSSSNPGYLGYYKLQNRGWRKDYFTSALPFPQKGPAVKIPYGDIEIDAPDNEDMPGHKEPLVFTGTSGVNPGGDTYVHEDVPGIWQTAEGPGGRLDTSMAMLNIQNAGSETPDLMSYKSGLAARLTSESLPTIEELRYAEVLQEFYEANARGGTKYKEYLQNIWHTRSKDSRLDRPEYLGGYRGPVTISDIDQTSSSSNTPQGTLAGKAVSAGGSRLCRHYRVPEWGIIMCIMSIVPKSAYYQGFRKWNLYNDVFDWPNTFFANLGEQEILNKELYFELSDTHNDDTFGYTPRYSEAKFIPDYVAGQFKTTLDYWHLARKFGSRPNLNSNFLHVQPSELDRIFPSQLADDDKFLATFFFHVKRRMFLPYWGVPRLIHSL